MDSRLKEYNDKMNKSIDALKEEYASIRAGRANPRILDKVTVDYYGQASPIQNIANISIPEARVIQIQPWESKFIKDIEKAILQSDIGITPSNDGTVVRLIFPELTEERRKELVKDIKKRAESAKVSVRNIRREANDMIKNLNKSSEISEDEQRILQEEVQDLTDKFTDEIDKICEKKSEEVLTV